LRPKRTQFRFGPSADRRNYLKMKAVHQGAARAMKRGNLPPRNDKAHAPGEFALSAHQLISALHPRASIEALLTLKPASSSD